MAVLAQGKARPRSTPCVSPRAVGGLAGSYGVLLLFPTAIPHCWEAFSELSLAALVDLKWDCLWLSHSGCTMGRTTNHVSSDLHFTREHFGECRTSLPAAQTIFAPRIEPAFRTCLSGPTSTPGM